MSTAKRRGNSEGSNPRKRPDGRWTVSLRYVDPDGLAKRASVYGKTADEAREKVAVIRRRLRRGQPAKDARTTVGAYAADWITGPLTVSDRAASTKAAYAVQARAHVAGSSLGLVTLDRLKPSHVERWLVELRDRGLSDATVQHCYAVARAICQTAVRDGMLATNPVAVIKRPRVTPKEAAFLDAGEVQALFDAASGTRYGPLFKLLALTGLRRGEALALRWGPDIDLDGGTVKVAGTLTRVDGQLVVSGRTKNGRTRHIPLSASAVEALRQQRVAQAADRLRAGTRWHDSDHVFTTEVGTPIDPRNALRALKVAARQIGRPEVGLHSLRHSAATAMLVSGVPITTVSKVLGHSSIAITASVYSHVSADHSREALERLGEAFA